MRKVMCAVVVIAAALMSRTFTAEHIVYRASRKRKSRLSKQFLGDHSNSWAIDRMPFMTNDDYIAFFMVSKNTFVNVLLPPYEKHWSAQRHERGSERKTSKRRRLTPKVLAKRLWTAEESLAISIRVCVGLSDWASI